MLGTPNRGSSLGACSSVANLDAGPIPNAPIPIPNGGASGPIAIGRDVDGSGCYVDGRWLIVARAARYGRSKQCTDGQSTNNAGGYLTTACNRSPGCKRQTKTACDQQTDQNLAHFGLSLPKSQIRAYRWCSPPRIGCATMSPNRSIARVQGASPSHESPPIAPSVSTLKIFGKYRLNFPAIFSAESTNKGHRFLGGAWSAPQRVRSQEIHVVLKARAFATNLDRFRCPRPNAERCLV
jgi:hypothetical protein